MELTDEEIRVLGCLIEKEATTPDQYPLSTNAIVNACNQKSNRHPVVDYGDRLVIDTMLLLRPAGLARTVSGGRADKHKHVLDEAWGLSADQLAVLAIRCCEGRNRPVSCGRGPSGTQRHRAPGLPRLSDIESVLQGLAAFQVPLVVNIGRGSGQSQDRWAHLLGSEVPDVNDVQPAGATSSTGGSSLAHRVSELEARLAVLEEALGVSTPSESGQSASLPAEPEGGFATFED